MSSGATGGPTDYPGGLPQNSEHQPDAFPAAPLDQKSNSACAPFLIAAAVGIFVLFLVIGVAFAAFLTTRDRSVSPASPSPMPTATATIYVEKSASGITYRLLEFDCMQPGEPITIVGDEGDEADLAVRSGAKWCYGGFEVENDTGSAVRLEAVLQEVEDSQGRRTHPSGRASAELLDPAQSLTLSPGEVTEFDLAWEVPAEARPVAVLMRANTNFDVVRLPVEG